MVWFWIGSHAEYDKRLAQRSRPSQLRANDERGRVEEGLHSP